MGTAVARILELWSAAAEEESWQVPLVTATEGLTAAQAAWSPGAGRNSIWRIVHHLTIWKEYFAGRLAGGPVEPPGWAKGIDWAPVPEPTEEAWEAARQRLLRAHDALKAELAKHADEDLEVPLPGSKHPLYRIQFMALHDAYHCGQICYIRALQNIPARGSWDDAA